MKLNTSQRKRFRVSNKVKRVAKNERFRLSIARSSKNISAQIIDDKKNITLLSASSAEKEFKSGSKIFLLEIIISGKRFFAAWTMFGVISIPS